MRKKMVKLMLGLVMIGISIVYLHAVIAFNDPTSPFKGKTSIQVGDMITDSASELLQSASEAFLFLNEVEIAGKNGLNVGAALQRVDMAAARVEQALKLFENIIQAGRNAGYNEHRISKLKNFSYDQFAKENGLSGETMTQVSAYLGRGNVLGFYQRHIRNLLIQNHRRRIIEGKIEAHIQTIGKEQSGNSMDDVVRFKIENMIAIGFHCIHQVFMQDGSRPWAYQWSLRYRASRSGQSG